MTIEIHAPSLRVTKCWMVIGSETGFVGNKGGNSMFVWLSVNWMEGSST